MEATSLALAALAGTGVLALVELVARALSARATRGPATTTALAVAASGGAALVVAAIATVEVEPSVALLAAASAGIALLVAIVLRSAARGDASS
jgi:hypothetical protein